MTEPDAPIPETASEGAAEALELESLEFVQLGEKLQLIV